jgi:hypothetical protein
MATPPGFADVSMRLNLATYNRPAFITYGVNPTATDPQTIASSLISAWTDTGSMNSKLDSNVTMSEVIVRLGTDGGEDIVGSVVNAIAGTAGLTSPPPNVSVLVYKRTARGGRRGRGRLYLPWFIGASVIGEDGVINATSVTQLATSVGAWFTALQTRNVPMYLLHAPGKTTPGAPNEVTSLVVSNVIGTQRRRLSR